MVDEICLTDCTCYDPDYGCLMPFADRWYACPLENDGANEIIAQMIEEDNGWRGGGKNE